MNLNKNEKKLYFINLCWSFIVRLLGGFKHTKFNSILIVKLDEIGDMVNAIHTFEMLKKQYPDAKLTLLCKPYAKPLLANNPFIDKIITDLYDWKNKHELVVELRGNYNTLKKSIQYMPKYRLDRGKIRFKNRGKQKHERITNSQIIEPIIDTKNRVEYPILDISTTEEKNVSDYLTSNKIGKYAVFHTMGRNNQRRWSSENFIQLSAWLNSQYHLKTILVGAPKEQSGLQQLSQKMGNHSGVFFQNNSLLDLTALLSKSSLFVGNESGPLQIACTLNIPLVGLFGPGVKNVFYPYKKNQEYIHKFSDNEDKKSSMGMISVDEVKKKLKEIIQQ